VCRKAYQPRFGIPIVCPAGMIVSQRIGMERPAGIHVWKQPLISGDRALLFPLHQQSQNVGIEYNLIL
jgi:hypothetical protein